MWLQSLQLSRAWIAQAAAMVVLLFGVAAPLPAQTWTWTEDFIEVVGGQSASMAIDRDNNLHVVYRLPQGGLLRYAFRPVGSSEWFKMTLDKDLGGLNTRIAVDQDDNPHVCYTPNTMKYAHFDGRKWYSQEVDPGSGLVGYECSIRITTDGRPMLAWYWPAGGFRYAVLQDGAWLAFALDGNPNDYAGKWNSMVLDSHGNPQIAYSDFPGGELRHARYTGKGWIRTVLDSQKNGPGGPKGMGVARVLDANENPWVSYYDERSLMVTHRVNDKWEKHVVEQLPPFSNWGWKQFHSDIALDSSGNPHVVFESLQGLEHAWWTGSEWRTQVILAPAIISYFDNSMVMGNDNVIYVVYTEPMDHSLRLAVGRPSTAVQSAEKTGEPR